MNNIQDLSFDELKKHSESQYMIITEQTKKIFELESKTDHLSSRLAESETKLLASSSLNIDQEENSDAETVCVVQIAMLKSLAMNRELTLEETKKVEILVKTLYLIKGRTSNKDTKQFGANLTTEQLLSLASNIG
jgi:hypothetical protein